jgi:hypothetical protein
VVHLRAALRDLAGKGAGEKRVPRKPVKQAS